MLMGCTESSVGDSCFHDNCHSSHENPHDQRCDEPNSLEVDKSHFCFKKAIGSGGFGIVQYAIKRSEPNKDEEFAIKSLSKGSILKRKSGLVSIFTELKILSSIQNNFICTKLSFKTVMLYML